MNDSGKARFNAACTSLAGKPEDEVLARLTQIADEEQLEIGSDPQRRKDWLAETAANVSFGFGWSRLS